MKKILLIISMIAIISIPAICQDAYEVRVTWTEDCDCLGYDQNNYFRVTISIYDDANNELVDSDLTGTVGGTETVIDIATVNVESYCGQIHTNTPSFTIRATVLFIETSTNPETVCCSDSGYESGISCSDIAGGHDLQPPLELD